jgi:hypothetical protein
LQLDRGTRGRGNGDREQEADDDDHDEEPITVKPCSVFPSKRLRIRLNIAATPSAVRSRWGVGGCGRKIGAALGSAYPKLGDSRVT